MFEAEVVHAVWVVEPVFTSYKGHEYFSFRERRCVTKKDLVLNRFDDSLDFDF